MSEEKSDFHKYCEGLDIDGFPIEEIWLPKLHVELTDEQIKQLREMMESRPLPCVRDEHGEIREQTVKQLFTKINEELDELKEVTLVNCSMRGHVNCQSRGHDLCEAIAAEAADTITAITTMLEALGIDADMRAEAQRRVNSKNRERGRL